MNQVIRSVLTGEIISPDDTVRVIGKTRPLAGERFEREVPAGLSITEILEEVLPKTGRLPMLASIDGHVIPTENWGKVRPKRGTTLTVTPTLHGNAQLRTVLSTVAAIAAIVIATLIVGPQGLALTGLTAVVVKAAIAAGIMLASAYALNALFPIRPPETPNVGGGTLNSIQGAQNQANPFGAIPVVLGRHRQSPYYAAKPYTEIIGDDQYLRLLFCCGYGPLLIEDIRIGETPLTSFSDYEIEIRQGFPADAPVTLYPGTVSETQLSVTLENAVDPPNTVGNNGTWVRQTTAAETDEISLDVTAAQGISAVDAEGDAVHAWRVWVQVRYRAVGAVSWIDPGVNAVFWPIQNPTRRGIRWVVPRGQYEVEVRRQSGQGDSKYVRDEITWTALRSIKNAVPVRFPKPLALIALRIKASGQLSGVINTLNCVTTSLVKAYSGAGSIWNADTPSQWPSDLFRHVLQGPANARPESDARIDLANLQEWYAYCVSKGFKFNQVVATVGSLFNKLADIASAGRAVPHFVNGKWGVSWDQPDASIVQHFTPANSWGFQGQHPYTNPPHGWRVSFINEKNGFTADERIVYDDGYDANNASLFEGIEFRGVTDPDLIWKHGRFHIAQVRLRPETITLNAGWEHLVCTRGNRVRVTHDVLMIGGPSGRVVSVVGQVVKFDQPLTLENGKTYSLRFRVPEDVRSFFRAVQPTPAGEHNTLTLAGDLSLVKRGTLYAFGETDRVDAVYRVKGISHAKDLIATLTLVDDAPDISLADQGAIPEYNPNVTIPPDPFSLPPRDLQYSEVIDGDGTNVRALVRLTWQVPRFGNILSFEVQAKFENAGQDWTRVDSVPPPRTSSDIAITGAGVWSFRVRCIFTDGTASDWATLSSLTIEGLSAEPGNVTNLHQRSIDGQTVLDWSIVEDKRLLNYEIRKGSTWDTGLVVGDAIAQPPWATTGDGTYHVRAYILSPFGARIYSEVNASIGIQGSIISRNIIISRDEQVTGWSGGGALDGAVIDGTFIRTDPLHPIVTPWGADVVSQLGLSGEAIGIFVSGQIVDIGRAAECRFWTEYEAVGVAQGADFLGTTTGLTDWLGQSDVLGASPTRSIRAFPIWRFASEKAASSDDIFAPADVFAESDVFAIEWGEWTKVASGTRVSRFFQPGYVLISDDAAVNATGTKFRWFVDVPDRTDDYTDLTVPNTGLALTFYTGGFHTTPTPGVDPVPFNGGPNGAAVPHVQRAIVDETAGDEVKVSALTAAGCTVHVLNGGVAVNRAGVNLLVRGF
jgi:hypothetical protein